ncbi:AAA family ATPase [Weissella cibaria]|uniref:Viral (Superfamily 1) RNA helicase n=1 Tax=Weissella cibaria TaxID=137591 RepID=A0A0D1LM39_9LACO|nr:AAA family ATPase [Weissella cibaria]KIU19762.1 Viral (Superfamily 1) RNA helicase [Weissella cibaria]MBZ5941255.1 AAA family ATPase [Weissella cibaria]MDV8929017.1 AAA family ATPase [Weissella cibaria]
MVKHKVIQAVAGAGKTYAITHNLDSDKRYLFLTYTNGNVSNLQRGLVDSHADANKYIVSTFPKFIIDWVINPFKPVLVPEGVDAYIGFSSYPPVDDSREPGYYTQDKVRHYLDRWKYLYLSRISGLAIYQKSNDKKFWDKVFERLSKFVDEVVVDEYQDLTGKDLKILAQLMKQKYVDVTLVGDVYQSQVQKSEQKTVAPYSGSWQDIEQVLYKTFGKRIEIDTESMKVSRRIGHGVARFIQDKLDIAITSDGRHVGEVHISKSVEDVETILGKKPIILVWDSKIKVPKEFVSLNWGYSKGDTLSLVLIVLTKVTENYLFHSHDDTLNSGTRNKLYVALSRSENDVHLVTSDLWKTYLKHKNI